MSIQALFKQIALPTANVVLYGAKGDGITDDTLAIRKAVNVQQEVGGIVYFPPGVYLFDQDLAGIVPAPNNGEEDAVHPLMIQGAGMYSTILKCGFAPGQTMLQYYLPGEFEAGPQNNIAQCIVEDLTIDGNYAAIDGGALALQEGIANGLIQLPTPFTAGGEDGPNGIYHYFSRVRFYRPTGFTALFNQSIVYSQCVFDKCGQPDLGMGAVHWDIIGGEHHANARVLDCDFIDSSGNYVDFTNDVVAKPCRLLFRGNRSIRHQRGGIYACGVGSIIADNYLVNDNAGDGVGYDNNAIAGNKSANKVHDNILVNLTVYAHGLSGSFGDKVHHNTASDSPKGNTTGEVALPADNVTIGPWPNRRVFYIVAGAGGCAVTIQGVGLLSIGAGLLMTVPVDPGQTLRLNYGNAPTQFNSIGS